MDPSRKSWCMALCRSEHNLGKSHGGEKDLIIRTTAGPEPLKTHPRADIQILSKARSLPHSNSQLA